MNEIFVQVISDNFGKILVALFLTLSMSAYILGKIAMSPQSINKQWDRKGKMWLGIVLIIAGVFINGMNWLLFTLLSGADGRGDMFWYKAMLQFGHANRISDSAYNLMENGLFLMGLGVLILLWYIIRYVLHKPLTDEPEIQKTLEDESYINPKLSKEKQKELIETYPRGLCYPYTARRMIYIINQKIREKHIPYRNPYNGGYSDEFTITNLAHWTHWFHDCHPEDTGPSTYYMLLEFDHLKEDHIIISCVYNVTGESLESRESEKRRPPVSLYFYSDAALQHILQQIQADPEHIMEKINQELAGKPFKTPYIDCSNQLTARQKTIVYDTHITTNGLIYPYSVYKIVNVINRWIRLYHIPFVNPSITADPRLAHTFTMHHLKLFHICFAIPGYLEPFVHPFLDYYIIPQVRFNNDDEFTEIPFYSEKALRFIVKRIKKNPGQVIRLEMRPTVLWLYRQFEKKQNRKMAEMGK